MSDKYILEGKTPVKADDVLVWSRWFENCGPDDRRVAFDEFEDGSYISTVFLALDHRFGNGPPVLFETMVFDAEGHGGDMDRYCTYEEAEAGHARMVAKFRWEQAQRDADGHAFFLGEPLEH